MGGSRKKQMMHFGHVFPKINPLLEYTYFVKGKVLELV